MASTSIELMCRFKSAGGKQIEKQLSECECALFVPYWSMNFAPLPDPIIPSDPDSFQEGSIQHHYITYNCRIEVCPYALNIKQVMPKQLHCKHDLFNEAIALYSLLLDIKKYLICFQFGEWSKFTPHIIDKNR